MDYGGKRTGIAVTDPLKIIASGLTTVQTSELFAFLKEYFEKEEVEKLLIGYPTHLDGTSTHATPLVEKFIKKFKKQFPDMPVEKVDERYTSKRAMEALIASGVKKKKRRNKALLDEMSAAIMLQEYLQSSEIK